MAESYAERVKRILGQTAPASVHGGQKVLLRCDRCGKVWLQDGAVHRPRLEPEEIATLLTELTANLATLPYATCDICAATHGGQAEIDEYMQGYGFGVSWEGPEPTGAHLLCSAVNITQAHYWRGPVHASVVTRFDRCRGFLAWLATIKEPARYHALSTDGSREMARMNKPGHGAPGTDAWVWRGGDWQADCPALGGPVQVSLFEAMPPGEPFSLALLVSTWRLLADRLQQGKIAGEQGEV